MPRSRPTSPSLSSFVDALGRTSVPAGSPESLGIVAVDCDLRRIHAWHSVKGPLFTAMPNPIDAVAAIGLAGADRILFEIASPVHYRDGGGAAHQLMRWALFNAYCATLFDREFPGRMLVAPSSVWTKGHNVTTRHLVARAQGKNKDLRECEAMLWFYTKEPKSWVPLDTYIGAL